MFSKVLVATLVGGAIANNATSDSTAAPTDTVTQGPQTIGTLNAVATIDTTASIAVLQASDTYRLGWATMLKAFAETQASGLTLKTAEAGDVTVSAGRRLSEERRELATVSVSHAYVMMTPAGTSAPSSAAATITASAANATVMGGLVSQASNIPIGGGHNSTVTGIEGTFTASGGSTSGAAPVLAGVSAAILGLATLF